MAPGGPGRLLALPVDRLGEREQPLTRQLDGRQIGGQNLARVRLPALDALYDRAQALEAAEATWVVRGHL